MPNWNSNTVTINGPKAKIAALWAAANSKEDSGLLEAMVPIGEWDYDRAVATWGTKWDVNMEGLELIDNEDGTASIVGYADSAWSPPLAAFQTYAAANEDVYLELKYFEPGMEFTGVWDSEGGDAYWEDVGSLLDTTEAEDPVLYNLLEHFDIRDWYEFDEDEEEMTDEA